MKAPVCSRNRFLRFLLALGFFLLEIGSLQATHLRAGNITLFLLDCSTRRYRIRVEVYTNTSNTNVLFGGEQDYLDFGDKTGRILVPEIGPGDARYSTDGLPAGTARAYYEIIHSFPGNGTYTVSYVEPNRNAGVLNMDQSVNTTFYIETQVVIDPFYGCSSPVDLGVPPIDRACTGVAWFHNPGATDPDGDRISYQMVVPFRDRAATVLNYRDPNDPKFYNNFGSGNELQNGPPTFSIDPELGDVKWDAPGAAGEYNIAFIVIDWRKINGVWRQMGYVRRDMQILVEDCNNKRPDLIIPEDVCVTAGETLEEEIEGFDLDAPPDNVRITAFSEVLNFSPQLSPATITPPEFPVTFQPSPGHITFRWNTICEHVREQPYTVNFKVEDSRGLVNYKTWRITVVGPAPTWNDASLNTNTRTATIKWDRYFCQNAEIIQVWRKVDSTTFRPDNCETGMPPGLGYEKIAEVPARLPSSSLTGQYVDNNKGEGLAPGAMYCYRLVAVYPLPKGGESYVSRDTCVGPIPADVPIITHVSVVKTDALDGQIRVSWKRPYDADPGTYPPPYEYRVYRALGFERAADSTLIATLDGDTTYLDGGLNTQESVYNYSITAYASNPAKTEVGSSETASSVRLGSNSGKGEIQLNWTAVVPWSNQIEAHPLHDIYRGNEGATEDEMTLIQSVNATQGGFQFTDTNVTEGQTYCYRIMTRGGYGNPDKIQEPLENYSQIICVQPGDSIPPCKPILEVALLDCETLSSATLCSFGVGTYSNTLTWIINGGDECGTDLRGYRIYRASSTTGEYAFVAEVGPTVTTYEDNNLKSFAACYKISAVDFSDNESELSDAACNDNCPNYMLPNVFSPNGDSYNDEFSAYSLRGFSCDLEECVVPEHLLEGCARFVKSVRFKVYNRWGQEVYTYEGNTSDEQNNIYIDWNGKDENGSMLTPAVYFYVAEVTFDVLNPDESVKTFKGWVHLLNDRQ